MPATVPKLTSAEASATSRDIYASATSSTKSSSNCCFNTRRFAAYYDDDISFDQLETLVGAEEAANLRVLKQQLDEDFVDEVADA